VALQIGSQVAGYRILGILGQGGMGVVYEAEHALLGRKAALKTLLSELSGNEDFKQRFIRESQVVAAIDHPNIIPIYDAGELAGTAYIAMRYVPGADLAHLIERRGALPPDEALSILDQAAAALDAAHARELVHRDVKPANILIEETTERIYLTDFGIVKEQGRSGRTQAGFFLGTIDYAAPEQIEGKELTPAADVYAFGCVLFECLAGRRPFVGDTDMAIFRGHVLDPPPQISVVRPGLPATLDPVIERALAKEPEQRFASCRELVEAARLALTGQQAAATAAPAIDTVAAGRIDGAPPRRRTTVSNLPVQTTPLVGREQDLAELTALLRDGSVRLLTLTGFGGTGKTRLSLEAASAVQEEFDRVILVDLAPVQDPEHVGTTIARELGAEIPPGGSAVEAVRDRLGSADVLLVLDNFEQVLPAAALVAELLAAVPSLRVLVTSQAPLRVRAETEFAVRPLGLPADVDPADIAGLSASPAVALFVDRARAVRADFGLTADNAEAVAAICTGLDGIPLAIELAAARVKLLSPQALRSRLERRLELLTGGAADLPARQRTLRGAIDWSYGLLDATEQAVLSRLGVFVGGCSLEAAGAVAGGPSDLDLGGTVDALASLVDKSLVRQVDAADGEPRFSMLETIREYALDKLEERGEAVEVRRLHAERLLELAETAEPELARVNQASWFDRLDEENGNLRAAQARSLEDGRIELCLRLAGALIRYWSIRGLMAEGRERLVQALASPAASDAPAPVRAKAEFAAGYAALGLGDFADAESQFARSLELGAGDEAAEAAARAQLAWLGMTRGDDGGGPALELATESLRQARAVDDKRTASGALNTLAALALRRGEPDEALALMEEALALRRGLGDKRLVANSLLELARARLARHELPYAEPLLDEGLTLAREIGDTWSSSVALAGLGRLRLLEDDPGRAVDLFRDALRLAAARRDKRAAADCLQGIGSALALQGELDLGARLLGAADATLQAIGAQPTPAERAVAERVHPRLHEELGDALAARLAVGQALTLDQAVALALPSARRGETSFETATL
jgi:non-specific serine/threonine protein kinase